MAGTVDKEFVKSCNAERKKKQNVYAVHSASFFLHTSRTLKKRANRIYLLHQRDRIG